MWHDAAKAELAAEALKITAPDLLDMKLIDEIVSEPDGGAHLDHDATARLLDEALTRALAELSQVSETDLVANRYQKFRRMGECFSSGIQPS